MNHFDHHYFDIGCKVFIAGLEVLSKIEQDLTAHGLNRFRHFAGSNGALQNVKMIAVKIICRAAESANHGTHRCPQIILPLIIRPNSCKFVKFVASPPRLPQDSSKGRKGFSFRLPVAALREGFRLLDNPSFRAL